MGATRDRWRHEIESAGWDEARLRPLCERHSGLPGPRANLELAAALADAAAGAAEAARPLLVAWAALGPEEAPTGTRAEFLPFAAVQALGAVAAAPAGREAALALVHRAAADPRWRLRAAAAMAMQQLGRRDPALMRETLSAWLEGGSALVWRLALGALADPPLLDDPATVALAWEVAELALAGLRRGVVGSPEEARVLGQALAFAPSVFAAADPDRGFAHLARWAAAPEREVKKLVIANLRKARLARRFPDRCQDLVESMWDD